LAISRVHIKLLFCAQVLAAAVHAFVLSALDCRQLASAVQQKQLALRARRPAAASRTTARQLASLAYVFPFLI
jgi:hypothetical protein